MRKIIMIALLLLGTLPAAAQLPGVRLEWGVIGGVNVPTSRPTWTVPR